MTSACFAGFPCEKFNRATLSPARMSRASVSEDSEAGPIVATILVLCAGSAAFMTRTSFCHTRADRSLPASRARPSPFPQARDTRAGHRLFYPRLGYPLSARRRNFYTYIHRLRGVNAQIARFVLSRHAGLKSISYFCVPTMSNLVEALWFSYWALDRRWK